mmetsp:Transcript_24521/g.61095  ORF Transcript_24521/g.61095 Transcript_24521/m.61095 type:complete len:267 (+) Transcript_24521:407-1207(+)
MALAVPPKSTPPPGIFGTYLSVSSLLFSNLDGVSRLCISAYPNKMVNSTVQKKMRPDTMLVCNLHRSSHTYLGAGGGAGVGGGDEVLVYSSARPPAVPAVRLDAFAAISPRQVSSRSIGRAGAPTPMAVYIAACRTPCARNPSTNDANLSTSSPSIARRSSSGRGWSSSPPPSMADGDAQTTTTSGASPSPRSLRWRMKPASSSPSLRKMAPSRPRIPVTHSSSHLPATKWRPLALGLPSRLASARADMNRAPIERAAVSSPPSSP